MVEIDSFRFVAVRDSQRFSASTLPRIQGYVPGKTVPVTPAVTGIYNAPMIVRVADGYLLRHDAPTVAGLLQAVVAEWQSTHPPESPAEEDPVTDEDTENAEAARRGMLAAIVSHADFAAGQVQCAESFASVALSKIADDGVRGALMRIMQIYAVLRAVAKRRVGPDDDRWLRDAVANAIVTLPPVWPVSPAAPEPPTPSAVPPSGPALADQPAAQQALEQSARLLSAAEDIAAQVTGEQTDPSINDVDTGGRAYKLTADRRGRLKEATRAVLTEISESRDRSIPDLAAELTSRAMDAFALAAVPGPAELARIRSAALTAALAGKYTPRSANLPIATSGAVLARPPRIGDLEVVRETFVCYEKGEVAHVENVMPKETRKRRHRIVDLAEREEVDVDEREEETTDERSSTSQSELSNEMSNVASSDTTLQAGGSVQARYGPYLEVSANAGFSKSTSSQVSSTEAQKYAQDITERAVARVRSRVMSSRRRLTKTEVTEENVHGFENESDNPIVGFYRWLNKRYQAEVFNVGQRLLLELVVPDPALRFRYASASGVGSDLSVDPPPPFTFPGGDAPLRPDHVTPATWKGLAARFRALVDPPPPAFASAAAGFQAQKSELVRVTSSQSIVGDPTVAVPSHGLVTEQLSVPAGYEPVHWTAAVLAEAQARLSTQPSDPSKPLIEFVLNLPGKVSGTIAVGPSVRGFSIDDTVSAFFAQAAVPPGALPGLSPDGTEEMTLPVAIAALSPAVLTGTVTVLCRRSQTLLDAWQMDTYTRLVQAHAGWEQQFQAALRSTEVGRGVAIRGSNPGENQLTMQTELKMMAIGLLGGPARAELIVTDQGNPAESAEPTLDAAKARQVGPEILFWEQAFEWENLAYVFYPYFWTGREDWPTQSRHSDPDPRFTEFLRAGAARVMVPVRPNFELTVCLRLALELPRLWSSHPAPVAETEPWTSIAEEVRQRQAGTEGVSAGASWPVVVPTTLVMLDPGTDLFDCPTSPDDSGEGEDRSVVDTAPRDVPR